ncbi:MAG: class I SAM-dependent methyltransferase [Blastocatellia bacterium]
MNKLLLFLLVLSVPAYSQQPQPAGQSRQNRSPDEYIQLLESERRLSGLQVDRVVESLKIEPGQRIADLGAGSGVFSRPMSLKTGPKGIIYAIDIDAELLKYLEKTARERNLPNIRTIVGTETDAKIPERVDLIAIIDTMHHIQNQREYVKGLRKYLKPDGRVAIIDFSRDWPAGHEKMIYTLADLDGWMKEAGFKRVEQFDYLATSFFVIYK